MENKQILCESVSRSKPTIQKNVKWVVVSNGAERNKPTISKAQATKPTGKK